MTLLADRRMGVRPDIFAGLVLVISGVAGISELLLPWFPAVAGLSRSARGWDLFVAGRSQDASLPFGDALALYAVLGVAVVGGAAILLGLAMFAPIDHQPIGAIALILHLASVGGATWWIIRSTAARGGFSEIMSNAQVGWYLFVVAGAIGLIGAIKALVST